MSKPDSERRALRIVYAGTPGFAVPALEALNASPHEVVAVLTQPDRPAGRGRRPRPSPVKEAALAANLPVHQPERLDEAARDQLASLSPDLMVVTAYGLLLPAPVLALPRFGCINIHASLLPRWRGAAPIQRAIQAGDAETGISIMQMDEGLDTGPVLMTRRLPLDGSETGGSLHDALAALGGETIVEAVDGIAAGTLPARPQDSDGACYARKLKKQEAAIDWRQPAAVIERQIRAFNPWPVAQTSWRGRALRIHAATVSDNAEEAAPGDVLAVGRDGVRVATGDGVLQLTEVQLPGRKRISGGDFANAGVAPGDQLGVADAD